MSQLSDCPACHTIFIEQEPNFCQNCRLPLPGTMLNNRYEIRAMMGEPGSFGVVYSVHDIIANQEKVAKLLYAKKKAAETLFDREAELLKRGLRGLPAFYDKFEAFDHPCIVMEKVQGKNLLTVLDEKGGAFEESELLPLMKQLADIIGIMHSENIIHRDIKPANLMCRFSTDPQQPELVLIDLGGAKQLDIAYFAKMAGGKTPPTLTQPGTSMLHSPGYGAPEQMIGQPIPQSDLYAIGATMIHLLTGRFPGDPDMIDAHTLKFDWRNKTRFGVSDDLAWIIDRLTEHSPQNRIMSARELRSYLDQLGSMKRPTRQPGLEVELAEIRCSSSQISFDDVERGVAVPDQSVAVQNEGKGTLSAQVSTDSPTILRVMPNTITGNKAYLSIGLNTDAVECGKEYKANILIHINSSPPDLLNIPVQVQVRHDRAAVKEFENISTFNICAVIGISLLAEILMVNSGYKISERFPGGILEILSIALVIAPIIPAISICTMRLKSAPKGNVKPIILATMAVMAVLMSCLFAERFSIDYLTLPILAAAIAGVSSLILKGYLVAFLTSRGLDRKHQALTGAKLLAPTALALACFFAYAVSQMQAQTPDLEALARASLQGNGFTDLTVLEVEKGSVSVFGIIDNQKDVERVEKIVLDVNGISKVHTEGIILCPLEPPSPDIAELAKAVLQKHGFDNLSVQQTTKRTLSVSGSVSREKDIERVRYAVLGVRGVSDVNTDGITLPLAPPIAPYQIGSPGTPSIRETARNPVQSTKDSRSAKKTRSTLRSTTKPRLRVSTLPERASASLNSFLRRTLSLLPRENPFRR